MVVDTRGINVWCAAGKGSFSAEEVAYQVQQANLSELVDHREIILPQLSANGVALHKLKKLCGFRGRFGPILSSKIPEYLEKGQASEEMRTVTFTFAERATLIPLEICMLWKQFLTACCVFFLISGIGPHIFSLQIAGQRSVELILSTFVAILGGSAITPLLLPYIPFRQFWLKGALVSFGAGFLFIQSGVAALSPAEKTAVLLWITGCGSFLAMNFTGSTVFTSLSGVKREMRHGLAFQLILSGCALVCWLISPFFN